MNASEPPQLAVDFMHPAPHLAGLISGYHIYSAGPLGSPAWNELFFPGWANIRFTLIDGGWHCGTVGEAMRPVPSAALFGPSSKGIYSRSAGGLMVGAGITPLGWRRFFDRPAHEFADQIVPLSSCVAEDWAALHQAAVADPQPATIKALLDAWLTDHLRPAQPTAGWVEPLFDWLIETHEVDLAAAEHALRLSPAQLRRLSRNHFGFSPKLLLRRSRFLKSITRVLNAPTDNWSAIIDASYYDYAHFIRDCQDFLGMAPRQFLALDRPMTRLSMERRAAQLGAPVQGLHRLPGTDRPLPRGSE